MNFDNLLDEEIIVAKRKCERSLLFFTRFFFRILRGSKFIQNWHHEDICIALEEIAKYLYKLLNINIPPRMSKTEVVGINFIAWSLAKNPRANFLYITASDELRSETSIRIRDIITHPVYIKMFGVEMKKDQAGKNLWRTKQGGGLKTATIFGQITGFGAGRMVEPNQELLDFVKDFDGAIILDDINKIIDSQSDNANNQKAIDTIFTTILSRVNSKDTPLINIQQRTSENDATAALLEHFSEEETKNIVLPVVYENKPLWPFKLDVDDIEKLKVSPKTAHIFQTQYMQDPTPEEGLMFPRSQLNWYSGKDLKRKKAVAKFGYIDTAEDGTDNYAFPLGYLYKSGKVYADEVIYNKLSSDDNLPNTIELSNKTRLEYLRVETNKEETIKKTLQRKLKATHVSGQWNHKNKHYRIKAQRAFILKFFWFRDDYEPNSEYAMFIRDLTKYRLEDVNKKDLDSPDALAGLSKFVRKIFPDIYYNY
jgi:hypothetical protein